MHFDHVRMKKHIKKITSKVRTWHIILFVAIIFIMLILFSKSSNVPDQISAEKQVREPVFAGSWYPGNSEDLSKMIDQFYSQVKTPDLNGTIKALIVPHAGYQYSGQVASIGFRQLDDIYETVYLFGPSHRYPLNGASINNVTHYKTPLGEILLSEKKELLLSESIINSVPEAHANEHSLEIELPFLQKQLSNLEILPILVGNLDRGQLTDVLLNHLTELDLVIVSVDLSHYHTYDEARNIDANTLEKISKLDSDGIITAEIDAPIAVATLLDLASEKSWKPIILYYANSGDVTGDKERVVGYSVVAFVDEKDKREPLTKNEQEFLLKLARNTISTYLETGTKPILDLELSPKLEQVQGCFTTLTKNHNLRGCIGHILPQEELYKCVMDNAINAAVNDRRFSKLTAIELSEVEVEVSVLSPPEPMEFSSGEDLMSNLRPMVDGVVLKQGLKSSTYLPQVWENFQSKEQFLSSLCQKGGMSIDCWQDTNTEVLTYQAFVFSESD